MKFKRVTNFKNILTIFELYIQLRNFQLLSVWLTDFAQNRYIHKQGFYHC